jgi:hypothetical protein
MIRHCDAFAAEYLIALLLTGRIGDVTIRPSES